MHNPTAYKADKLKSNPMITFRWQCRALSGQLSHPITVLKYREARYSLLKYPESRKYARVSGTPL